MEGGRDRSGQDSWKDGGTLHCRRKGIKKRRREVKGT